MDSKDSPLGKQQIDNKSSEALPIGVPCVRNPSPGEQQIGNSRGNSMAVARELPGRELPEGAPCLRNLPPGEQQFVNQSCSALPADVLCISAVASDEAKGKLTDCYHKSVAHIMEAGGLPANFTEHHNRFISNAKHTYFLGLLNMEPDAIDDLLKNECKKFEELQNYIIDFSDEFKKTYESKLHTLVKNKLDSGSKKTLKELGKEVDSWIIASEIPFITCMAFGKNEKALIRAIQNHMENVRKEYLKDFAKKFAKAQKKNS